VFDPSSATTQHIFFDDNIKLHDAGIVDARHVDTGESLPFKDVVNKHLVPVSALEALLDDEYFINKLAACEREFERVS
jgi:hypothetical protein